MSPEASQILWFDQIGREDISRVGGKIASLGEMSGHLGSEGICVPLGFATTAEAYWMFVERNGLREIIARELGARDTDDRSLANAGRTIRTAFRNGEWPVETATAITGAYAELGKRLGRSSIDVAVRSSATAEDLPEASFAGQLDSYLNIRGRAALLDACRRCYASLFTDRAIGYRKANNFDHLEVALSVGVQQMVRSDRAGAGVMFSIDTETGFPSVAVINAGWGLGESVVKGIIDPDEYVVFKPLLDHPEVVPIIEKKLGCKTKKIVYARGDPPTRERPTRIAERKAFVLGDEEIQGLARWACLIERHYGRAMDIEWAKDGDSGKIFIVQARPETAQARRGALQSYRIKSKGSKLAEGSAVGEAIATGPVCIVRSPDEAERFIDGSILVAPETDPDWVPIMRRAAAIVTDHGGRTSHAAIVSREMGLPAVVGTGNGTEVLKDGQEITVSCAEGDQGFVYEGRADYEVEGLDLSEIPETRTQVMLNQADPAAALRWWPLPADGVGLARMEFVVTNHVKIHPMALAHFDSLAEKAPRRTIAKLTEGYDDKTDYFVDRLSRGLARIAAVRHPKPVIVRMSDFKTNEYAGLIGGAEFEPKEQNPMLGLRGASRYYSSRYRDGFELECRAIRRLREELGFSNVIVMIPFCRTVEEAIRVLEVMAENGLKRGDKGLQVYAMCEIPSNVILAKKFAEHFDGFSIGSNDLTQLTLGIDRDSEDLAELFDEQNEAVKWMIERLIVSAHEAGAKVGLCGQAPSDHPEFADFLVRCGIDSISVSPDSFLNVKRRIAEAEQR